MKNLTGLILLAVEIIGNDLLIVTTKGTIKGIAVGDCCSRTWVQSVDSPSKGYPAVVLRVAEKHLSGDWIDGGEYLQNYGITIYTDKGDIDIVFRNESNGYYGGWLEFDPIVTFARH